MTFGMGNRLRGDTVPSQPLTTELGQLSNEERAAVAELDGIVFRAHPDRRAPVGDVPPGGEIEDPKPSHLRAFGDLIVVNDADTDPHGELSAAVLRRRVAEEVRGESPTVRVGNADIPTDELKEVVEQIAAGEVNPAELEQRDEQDDDGDDE